MDHARMRDIAIEKAIMGGVMVAGGGKRKKGSRVCIAKYKSGPKKNRCKKYGKKRGGCDGCFDPECECGGTGIAGGIMVAGGTMIAGGGRKCKEYYKSGPKKNRCRKYTKAQNPGLAAHHAAAKAYQQQHPHLTYRQASTAVKKPKGSKGKLEFPMAGPLEFPSYHQLEFPMYQQPQLPWYQPQLPYHNQSVIPGRYNQLPWQDATSAVPGPMAQLMREEAMRQQMMNQNPYGYMYAPEMVEITAPPALVPSEPPRTEKDAKIAEIETVTLQALHIMLETQPNIDLDAELKRARESREAIIEKVAEREAQDELFSSLLGYPPEDVRQVVDVSESLGLGYGGGRRCIKKYKSGPKKGKCKEYSKKGADHLAKFRKEVDKYRKDHPHATYRQAQKAVSKKY